MTQQQVQDRILQEANALLQKKGYISPIEVLVESGFLNQQQVDLWRRGRIPRLDNYLHGSARKIFAALDALRRWALGVMELKSSETGYLCHSPDGERQLQFSSNHDPVMEKLCLTNYLSAALPEAKQSAIREKLEKPEKPAVFQVVRSTECSECGIEIWKGGMIYLEQGKALCLACAKMNDLEFLPAGDTALTRRSTKHSSRCAVVVRFSRSRGRYERQGILVEPQALAQAEEECTADAGERAAARKKAAVARIAQDERFAGEFEERIRDLFPGCPREEARAIALHTSQRGSGRVGRSEAGRSLSEQAVTLAVVAAARHRHTNYDELLARGVDREEARATVRHKIDRILDLWKSW